MSVAPGKSFFSGLHLAVTGLAAFVMATVAVLGFAINQGWLSGNSTSKPSGGTTTTSSSAPQFAVTPQSLALHALTPMGTVSVTNTGSAPLTVEAPSVVGPDASHFAVQDQTCGGPVGPGASCTLQVNLTSALSSSNATLVIPVRGAQQPIDVPLTGSAL